MISPDGPLQILIAIGAFIVAIGILVAVHEFGHFWVARRLGIRVLRFSIGFGTPLWRRVVGRKDPVEFVIAGIPIGGYVRLLDEREGNVPAEEAHRAFNRQPVWKRVAVLLAGPVFNFLLAIFVYWILFMVGEPVLKPFVREVAPDSIASRAGLREQERILEVGGKSVERIENVPLRLVEDLLDDQRISMVVASADGNRRNVELVVGEGARALTEPQALFPGLGFQIGPPRVAPVVGELVKGGAAEQAGLRVGDRIVAIDGQPIDEFTQISTALRERAGQRVTLRVSRNGSTMELPAEVRGESIEGKTVGRLGVGVDMDQYLSIERFGVLESMARAAEKTADMSAFTVRVMARIVTGDVSLKAISGPISIAETTGYAARQGLTVFLSMLAIISISLGVLNLLPIPILDGGQIVYQLAELVKGKPVSERAQIVGQQIGIAMLILMVTLAFYNDIARHLS